MYNVVALSTDIVIYIMYYVVTKCVLRKEKVNCKHVTPHSITAMSHDKSWGHRRFLRTFLQSLGCSFLPLCCCRCLIPLSTYKLIRQLITKLITWPTIPPQLRTHVVVIIAASFFTWAVSFIFFFFYKNINTSVSPAGLPFVQHNDLFPTCYLDFL